MLLTSNKKPKHAVDLKELLRGESVNCIYFG